MNKLSSITVRFNLFPIIIIIMHTRTHNVRDNKHDDETKPKYQFHVISRIIMFG